MDFNISLDAVNTPVTYGELFKILEIMTNSLTDTSETLSETLLMITDKTIDIDYKRFRDFRFLLDMMCAYNHLDKSKIHKYYTDWCDKYDKLNKGDKNEG